MRDEMICRTSERKDAHCKAQSGDLKTLALDRQTRREEIFHRPGIERVRAN